MFVFVIMTQRPPITTRTDTLLPYTSLFRSVASAAQSDCLSIIIPFFNEQEVLPLCLNRLQRSDEHTYELQSQMRISYAAFCLKKKRNHNTIKLAIQFNASLIDAFNTH